MERREEERAEGGGTTAVLCAFVFFWCFANLFCIHTHSCSLA